MHLENEDAMENKEIKVGKGDDPVMCSPYFLLVLFLAFEQLMFSSLNRLLLLTGPHSFHSSQKPIHHHLQSVSFLLILCSVKAVPKVEGEICVRDWDYKN